ncbi:MAG TPA: Na/Pi symporter [Rhodocyclaceae bacterium]|nr:Na/Pi symporter [Rhodocyclaceae bacterium]
MSRQLALAAIFLALGWGFWVSPDFKAIAAGVAIFLFGMLSLEEGFKAFTGGTLERILQKFTNRLWKSCLFGVVTSTIMQSSTLVSIITISFLSAGLLGLAQGIGIVIGANLGSSTGAWIIAGIGLKIDIAAYAMPILTFGVILVLNSNKALKGTGYVLAGIGFLFLGIHYIKEGFDAFQDTIDLAAFAMDGVAGLLLYTLIGIIATVITQSSHATLALVITALAAQQITYDNALALAIGANIGTTATAVIGALKANVAGKRLAAAHVIFNVGTGIFALILIQPYTAAVEIGSRWLGIAADDYILKVALFHSLFNLTGTLIMLPLTERLSRLLETHLKPKPRTVSAPRFITESMLGMPDAGLEAARKELQHLFSNVFDVMALVLHADPIRLRRGESLELLANPPERVRSIDVDEYYQSRIKPLHGSILDFLARMETNGPQSRQAFMLRSASQDLIEALKDLKHLQKNLVRFLGSPNPYLRKEYVLIRQRLALLLHALEQLRSEPPESVTLTLDVLGAGVEEKDIVANGQLDRLIRERRIDAETATSLMNDSAYAYDIAHNLLAMSRVILARFEPVMHEIEHQLHLDKQELKSVLDQTVRGEQPKVQVTP